MKIKRVFLTISVSASSGYEDSIWKSIFLDTLIELGYEVYFYPYHKAKQIAGNNASLEDVSQIIFEEFENQNKLNKFDLFFSYYNERQISSSLFSQLKGKVFILNYTTNFHQISTYKGLLVKADLSTYASIDAKNYFISNNLNGYYLPFAGLKKYARKPGGKKNGRLSFIGTAYGNRPYYLWRILQQQLPLEIYGANWLKNHKLKAILRAIEVERRIIFEKDVIDQSYKLLNDLILKEITVNYKGQIHNPLSDPEYFDLLSSSSIIINFPESRFEHDYNNPNVLLGSNLRDFEVPTAGGCLFTQLNEEIITFFEPGKEIITFANEWEMIDKIKFYLNRPDVIDSIALAGYDRAVKEHTWNNRFSALFKYIEENML